MDTVGTFEAALELANNKLFTTIHKHYTVDEWKQFYEFNLSNKTVSIYYLFKLINQLFENVAISSGTSDNDFKKMEQVCDMISELKYICIDVANGRFLFY